MLSNLSIFSNKRNVKILNAHFFLSPLFTFSPTSTSTHTTHSLLLLFLPQPILLQLNTRKHSHSPYFCINPALISTLHQHTKYHELLPVRRLFTTFPEPHRKLSSSTSIPRRSVFFNVNLTTPSPFLSR